MMSRTAKPRSSLRCSCFALILLLLPTAVQAADQADGADSGVSLTALVAHLEQAATGDTGTAEDRRLLHQLRNSQAMAELVNDLPARQRPQRVLYLAAGSHLAALAVCEALPVGSPCSLRYTEIDASVQEEIEHGLQALHRERCISRPSATAAIAAATGKRRWRFELAGHAVELSLQVSSPQAGGGGTTLLRPDELAWPQLIISHDWSGDPIENLRVILGYLLAARVERSEPRSLPMLMIEDLERHPYPIDLELFAPLARTTLPYGHRASSAGVARHGGEELGAPLFGGAVLLGFTADWWQRAEQTSVTGLLDLLLLDRFDSMRQNVLEGGSDPLLAPALLDWWTSFGDRSVRGDDIRLDRAAALQASVQVAPLLGSELRRRLGCRVELYRSLLEVRAAGGDERALLPSASLQNRPRPGAFPSPEMERQYRLAMRRAGAFHEAQLAARQQALPLLDLLQEPPLQQLSGLCPVAVPAADNATNDATAEGWAATYNATVSWLSKGSSIPAGLSGTGGG